MAGVSPPESSPLLPHSRPARRWPALSDLMLVLAAFTVANALALLLMGPPAGAPEGRPGRLAVAGDDFATPAARATAESLERLRKAFVLVSCNTVAAAVLGFAALARGLEARRRLRLGLPEGIDEHALLAHRERPASPASQAGQYRPSLN